MHINVVELSEEFKNEDSSEEGGYMDEIQQEEEQDNNQQYILQQESLTSLDVESLIHDNESLDMNSDDYDVDN